MMPQSSSPFPKKQHQEGFLDERGDSKSTAASGVASTAATSGSGTVRSAGAGIGSGTGGASHADFSGLASGTPAKEGGLLPAHPESASASASTTASLGSVGEDSSLSLDENGQAIAAIGQGFVYREVVPRNRYGSLQQRLLRPLTKGGIRQSVITLTSTAVGGGVLTLPYAMSQTGVLLGSGILILSALASIAGIEILMRKTTECGAVQYGELVGKHIKGFGTIFDIALTVYGFGVQIAYLNFLGDFFPTLSNQVSLFPPWLRANGDGDTARIVWMWLCLVVVIPLSIPKRLSALRYCSVVAGVALIFMAGLIIGMTPSEWSKRGNKGSDVQMVSLNWNFFTAMGNFIFAYNCHLNVVPVASELVEGQPRRIRKIAITSVLMQVTFYLFIAICGYCTFLGGTNQDVLAGYDATIWTTLGRLLLALTLLFALPINLNPTLRSLLRVCDKIRKKWTIRQGMREIAAGAGASGAATGSGGETGAAQSQRDLDNGGTSADAETREALRERARNLPKYHDSAFARGFSATVYVVLACTVACVVPSPATVIGLMSCAIGTFMMLILPAYIAGEGLSLRTGFLFAFGAANLLGFVVLMIQAFGYLKVETGSVSSSVSNAETATDTLIYETQTTQGSAGGWFGAKDDATDTATAVTAAGAVAAAGGLRASGAASASGASMWGSLKDAVLGAESAGVDAATAAAAVVAVGSPLALEETQTAQVVA